MTAEKEAQGWWAAVRIWRALCAGRRVKWVFAFLGHCASPKRIPTVGGASLLAGPPETPPKMGPPRNKFTHHPPETPPNIFSVLLCIELIPQVISCALDEIPIFLHSVDYTSLHFPHLQ